MEEEDKDLKIKLLEEEIEQLKLQLSKFIIITF
jgi:hypothetical protein